MMFGWGKDTANDVSADIKVGSKPELEPVPSPVSEALILICEKCGKKLSEDPESNPARTLGLELKSKIKESGGKGKIRAVVTGCLDVCPKGALTVGISRANATGDEFYTIQSHFDLAADVILDRVTHPTQPGSKP